MNGRQAAAVRRPAKRDEKAVGMYISTAFSALDPRP